MIGTGLAIFLKSLWFLIPAGFANTIPPIAARLFPKWSFPLDFNLTFRGKRVFGSHKTIRGIVFGCIGAVFMSYSMSYLFKWEFHKYGVFDFSESPFLYGLMQGLGALGGDAIKSFFKRQMDIPSGKSWPFFDQADWILGVLILFGLLKEIPFPFIIASLITGVSLHLIFRFVGFILGIVKEII